MAQQPAMNDEQMAELTARARAISQEAGAKVTSAMRDMIGAAAGIAGFAVESARDLVQYMVRRGQMTQDEADKLMREAEAVHAKRPKAERERLAAAKMAADKAAAEKKAARIAAETALPLNKPLSKTVKTPPPRPRGEEPSTAEKPAAAPPEKIAPVKAAKVAAPAKAAKVAAPMKAAPPAKTAPLKATAKAPAVKKAAAKAPAKKVAKKKK